MKLSLNKKHEIFSFCQACSQAKCNSVLCLLGLAKRPTFSWAWAQNLVGWFLKQHFLCLMPLRFYKLFPPQNYQTFNLNNNMLITCIKMPIKKLFQPNFLYVKSVSQDIALRPSFRLEFWPQLRKKQSYIKKIQG